MYSEHTKEGISKTELEEKIVQLLRQKKTPRYLHVVRMHRDIPEDVTTFSSELDLYRQSNFFDVTIIGKMTGIRGAGSR